MSHEWFQCLCCHVVGQLIQATTNPEDGVLTSVKLVTECVSWYEWIHRIGWPGKDVEVVPLWVHASEALFSSKNPGRKGVEHRTAWANCFYFQNLSNLVRKLERCLVRLPAWEAQCLKEKPLFFLCKLPCWWIFFIAWERAGTLHYRQLFPKAWCLLLVGRHPSCSIWEIVRSL